MFELGEDAEAEHQIIADHCLSLDFDRIYLIGENFFKVKSNSDKLNTYKSFEDFKKIDGYSNKYWGWGYEDDDLLYRCKKNNLELDLLKIKNLSPKCTSLKFNGVNAYVKSKKTFSLNNNLTFFVSFKPEKFICNHMDVVDDFNVFTIPGYDFSISYNSFSRYNFCTFDNDSNALYVNSKIKKNY